MTSTPASVTHLFVYGTLRPGDVRWHHLAPFVVDEGWDDSAAGSVFDTGLDYPAAKFDDSGTIHGRTYRLLAASLSRCLEILDEVEGVVDGEYRRIQVTTGSGTSAWTYEYGAGLELTLIESGDWMNRENASRISSVGPSATGRPAGMAPVRAPARPSPS